MNEKPKVLVVDDEQDMLDFLERALRRRFLVSRAQNPDQALEILQNESFALLITDHKMPRMSGLQLLEAIAGQHPEMKRILLSGYAEHPDLDRAKRSAHIHGYIFKPVDSRQLLGSIDEVFEDS